MNEAVSVLPLSISTNTDQLGLANQSHSHNHTLHKIIKGQKERLFYYLPFFEPLNSGSFRLDEIPPFEGVVI